MDEFREWDGAPRVLVFPDREGALHALQILRDAHLPALPAEGGSRPEIIVEAGARTLATAWTLLAAAGVLVAEVADRAAVAERRTA